MQQSASGMLYTTACACACTHQVAKAKNHDKAGHTSEDPAAVIHAALGVLEQLKLLLLPDISQFLELSLNGQLLDSGVGNLRDLWTVLVQPHGKHVAKGEGLRVHVKLLTCKQWGINTCQDHKSLCSKLCRSSLMCNPAVQGMDADVSIHLKRLALMPNSHLGMWP